MDTKVNMDLDAYVERTRNGPCFICKFVEGDPDYHHHKIHEDDDSIIFLSKYPTLPGYTIVSPKPHIEDLADGLSPTRYLDLQEKIHLAARALKKVFKAERIYILSLGSQQGNSHLHWHVVPLPQNVPYEQQQFHALMAENGILSMTAQEMSRVADDVGACYRSLMAS